ncbi:hypothetical protein NDU88_004026 [Pleurodeles waltl]|uniref:Uncharacterized protein n=1 Tax=Pleurodeles waltl TaxID=8319 RepID=A0AAV7NMA1_PLEWA|nr:hypothetical protein NDU88_004026 [Pleurodeles waltl]
MAVSALHPARGREIPQTSPAAATYVSDLRLKILLSPKRAFLALILPQSAFLFYGLQQLSATRLCESPHGRMQRRACSKAQRLSFCAARVRGLFSVATAPIGLVLHARSPVFAGNELCLHLLKARIRSKQRLERSCAVISAAVQPGWSRRGGTPLLEAACRERGLHPATFHPRKRWLNVTQ